VNMKILFGLCFLVCFSMVAEAKEITLVIPDDEILIVENDVPDAVQWIKSAWVGKVANCKSRIVQAEVKLSIQSGEKLPVGEDAIALKYLQRPDYKSRAERDLESLNLNK
jgi:hypothetical protein